MEQEVFKPIKNYEQYYEVSNMGRIKSLPKRWSVGVKKETILKAGHRKNGYDFVVLCVNKIKVYATIHRIVAKHFCENPNSYQIVNHLNGNKRDNRAINLEWTTQSGNVIHAFKTGLKNGMKGEAHHNTKVKTSDILEIRNMYKESNLSQFNIGIKFGLSQSQIGRIINNKRWSHI